MNTYGYIQHTEFNEYEFSIINEKTGEKYQLSTVNGKGVIGVNRRDAFSIKFKNNSFRNIQVRLVMDGTDVITGEFASTSPSGEMWYVPAYGECVVKAWPETNDSGAKFVFSDLKKSVAKHVHGNTSKTGLIEAYVYIEKNQINWKDNNQYTSIISRGLAAQSVQFQQPDYTYGGGFGSSGLLALSDTISFNSMNATYDCSGASASLTPAAPLAVGAGEQVEQKLQEVKGLSEPVLYDVLTVSYVDAKSIQKVKTKRVSTKNVPKTHSVSV